MPSTTAAHVPPEPAGDALPRLTRRAALFGAAALCAPLLPGLGRAAAPALAPVPDEVIRLDSNENPYGPSPRARAAILGSAVEAPRYASDAIDQLTEALAGAARLTPDQVVIGSGSSELLKMAALLAAEAGPGGELVAAVPTFEDLPEFAAKLGVATRWVPLDAQHRHDLEAMATALSGATRLVYVCNPNNPTGTTVPRAALEAFVRRVGPATLVVVDEAYIDFTDGGKGESLAALVRERPNLIVLRTFSKIHGLAGLRIGYALADAALAARLRRWLVAWPNVAGVRAARASLTDTGFLTTTRAALIADRRRIEASLDGLGAARTASQANFVFFDSGRPIREFEAAMQAQGIRIGRPFPRYERWARVTVGTRPEVDRVLAVLPGLLRARG